MSRAPPTSVGLSSRGRTLYCIPFLLNENKFQDLPVLQVNFVISGDTFALKNDSLRLVSHLKGIPTNPESGTSLYKLSQPILATDPDRKGKCLSFFNQSQKIEEGRPILDYWQAHVIDDRSRKRFISVIMIVERTAPKSSLDMVRTQREEKSFELAGQGSPSVAAKDFVKMNTAYCNTEQEEGAFIFRGWPLENKRTSPAIFNVLLASVKDGLDNISANNSGIVPTPELLEISATYISAVAKLQPKEKPRHDDIKAVLTRVFQAKPTTTKLTAEKSPVPDIVWTTEFLGKRTPIILCEVKNYLGIQGDAIFQVAASYSKVVSTNRTSLPPAGLNFNYPVILMGCMGTLLQIYVAIHLDGVFKCLAFYEGQGCNSNLTIHRYPSTCEAFGYRGMFPLLEFWSRVQKTGKPDTRSMGSPDPIIRHNIFFATLKGWRDTTTGGVVDIESVEVAVKFTYTYNAKVHMKLSEDPMKLAPQLFFCERIRGGLYMVVMERYIAKTLQDELSEARDNPENPQILTTIQQASSAVQNALQILSESSFVHGNGSTSKVLIGFPATTSHKEPFLGGNPVFKIIGFDFAGEAKKDRYFPHLPSKTLTTANGDKVTIDRGAKMEVNHDQMGFAECLAQF